MAKRNPSLFGEDLVKRGKQAVGLALTAGVTDKFVWPHLKQMAPGSGMASQVAHGATDIGVAWAIGQGLKMLGQAALGRDFQDGGTVLGIGEVVLSPIPGASISGNFPTSFPNFMKPAAVAPAATPSAVTTGSPPLLLPSGAPAAAMAGSYAGGV